MILPGGKRSLMIGVLLLGLVSCSGNSQLSALAPESPSPSTAESPSPSISSASQAEPDTPEGIATKDEIWSRLRQADTHYYVLMHHAVSEAMPKAYHAR
jgi:hypothetical protein